MISKIGKPLNVARFKKGALKIESLRKTQKEFARLAKFVLRSPHAEPVKACYVCGSMKSRKETAVYGIPYVRCLGCSHVYASRRLKTKGMEEYYRKTKSYSADYANPATYRYRLKEIALPKIEFVRPLVKTKRRRWLDVGSGIGDIVVAAKKRGFAARGIEISRDSAEFAKKVFGVTLTSEPLTEVLAREGEGSYDVISFFGVLEHIPDMKTQVALASKLLAKGGLLVIEVPHADSFSTFSDFLYPEQVTRHLYPPFHIMAFTEKSLDRLMGRYGMKSEAIWYFGLDFYNLLAHFGMQSKRFIGSPLAEFLVNANNEFQDVIDRKKMSDEVILVARKTK